MLWDYFQKGGPLMIGIAGCWVVALTLILDRLLYWSGVFIRRPVSNLRRKLVRRGLSHREVSIRIGAELRESERNLSGLASLSQLATSVGLFGTILGLCRSFLGNGLESDSIQPVSDSVIRGLSTALLTTVGGLSVFLVSQLFLIAFQSLTESLRRRGNELLDDLDLPRPETS